MGLFISNILLALLWALMQAKLTVGTLLTGFILGYLALSLLHRKGEEKNSYLTKSLQIVGFILFFTKELVVSSLRVAREVFRPLPHIRPGVIGIPLELKTDLEITLFANLISLTPGTLSLDVSDDHSTLYIHAMYVENPDELRTEIKEGLERRLLELLR